MPDVICVCVCVCVRACVCVYFNSNNVKGLTTETHAQQLTKAQEVGQDGLCLSVVHHLAFGEEGQRVEELEDGIAGLVDGHDDNPSIH